MKKTILVGFLAAMMLFAFTACEQAIPEFPKSDVQVLSAEIVDGDLGYLVGRSFDPSRYTVEITFNDLSTTTVNGASILTADDDFGDTAGAQEITVNYGNVTTSPNHVYVYSYDAASISVDNSAADTSYAVNGFYPDAVDKDDLVVTVVRTDGVEETLTNDEYTIRTLATTGTNGVVTIVFEDLEASYNISLTAAPVEDPDPAMTYVNGIKSVEWVGDDIYRTASGIPATIQTASNWKIIATTPYGDYELQAGDASNVDINTATSITAPGTYTAQVVVTVGTESYYAYGDVTVLDDITGIALSSTSYSVSVPSNQDYRLSVSDLQTIATYITAVRDGNVQVNTGFTITDVSNDGFIPRGVNSQSFDLTFTWSGNNNSKEYSSTITVNVIRTANV